MTAIRSLPNLGSVPFADIITNSFMSDRRHLLPSVALLRTVRATFTAYGSSLHEGT